MFHIMRRLLIAAIVLAVTGIIPAWCGVTLVSGSKPVCAVYIEPSAPADVRTAAEEICTYLEKMSGARLDIRESDSVPANQPAIMLDSIAIKSGLKLLAPTRSKEAYSIRTDGRHVLIGGESPTTTLYAAYHFLETLGCRWFMEGELGEVVPSTKTIKVGDLDIKEKPDFTHRAMWGSEWFSPTRWKTANRCGGESLPAGHAWSGLVPEDTFFGEHPEYYSLINGERRPKKQLCTSNPAVARIAAETVLERFRKDPALAGASLSPNDGGGFCTCDDCRALDVPGYLEPSSGAVCLSDRLQVFYNDVARAVAREFPNRTLSVYAYADYTLPPKRERKIEPNLMVWITPIRHCRLHGIGSSQCPSRERLGKLIDEWSKLASRIGYRTYNYNLAECIAPYSKITIWKQEIPFLQAHKCTAINNETLYSPAINGPHIYLSVRLAWDADADVDAIMADYYEKFCGKAAPYVKSYWERIDKADRETLAHEGGFGCLPRILTPDLLTACDGDLTRAEKAAADDPAVRERVRMFRRGFESARMFIEMNDALNAFDFMRARERYERLLAHTQSMVADHILDRHGVEYLQRFVGTKVLGGNARCTDPNSLVAKLPDQWLFRYDPENRGESDGYWKDDSRRDTWRTVKTFSATLEEQGIPEQSGIMWYATSVDIPRVSDGARLLLWMSQVYGTSRVWVNGQLAGENVKADVPFDMEVTGLIKPGTSNSIVVRADHSRPGELSAFGIAGPAIIYSSPTGSPPASEQ